jgi:hypothetical protein
MSNPIVSQQPLPKRRLYNVTVFCGKDPRASSYKDYREVYVYANNSTHARLLVQSNLAQFESAIEARAL